MCIRDSRHSWPGTPGSEALEGGGRAGRPGERIMLGNVLVLIHEDPVPAKPVVGGGAVVGRVGDSDVLAGRCEVDGGLAVSRLAPAVRVRHRGNSSAPTTR